MRLTLAMTWLTVALCSCPICGRQSAGKPSCQSLIHTYSQINQSTYDWQHLRISSFSSIYMFYCSFTAQIFLQNWSLRSAILPAVIVMKITECCYNHHGYEVYVSIIMMSLFSHSNNYQGHHKISTIIIYKTKQNFSEGVHMHVYMFECVCAGVWCPCACGALKDVF